MSQGAFGGVRGSQIQKCWKDAKQLDRSGPYLAHVCIFAGNGHELKSNLLISEGHGGLGGHQLIYLGKVPNHWTDRDQIWHTYTDSSGNGHRLNN